MQTFDQFLMSSTSSLNESVSKLVKDIITMKPQWSNKDFDSSLKKFFKANDVEFITSMIEYHDYSDSTLLVTVMGTDVKHVTNASNKLINEFKKSGVTLNHKVEKSNRGENKIYIVYSL